MDKEEKHYPYEVLAKLDEDKLKVLASDLRADILSATLRNGGHLSSNLGVVELTISLLRNFDPLKDDILFDVGHQTYAYKILTGRSLDNLRKTDGLAPFSDRFSSQFDKYNNGHASTSISTAYGIAKAKQLLGDNSYTIAVIGDSSIVSGLSMEALNLISDDKKLNLMIIVNDNNMSIGKHVGHISKNFVKLRNSRIYFRTASRLGRLMQKSKLTWKLFLKMRSLKDHIRRFLIEPTFFEAMSIKYEGPVDGHDFSALDFAFIKAKKNLLTGPLVLHVLTKKGYGYLPAMNDEQGQFHGVKNNFDKASICSNTILDFVSLKSLYLLDYMRLNPLGYVITPAMELGSGLETVFSTYPNRCIDVGIAEEHAVTMAAGLALKGTLPIVDIYSTFLQRAYDEIIEDVSRNKVKVVFLIERAGLVGEDGGSHHGIYDVAMARSIPYSQVYMPYDKRSMARLFKEHFFVEDGPTFFRLTKDSPIEEAKVISHMSIGDIYEENTSDVLILGVGPRGYTLFEKLDKKYSKVLLLNLLPSLEELKSIKVFDYKKIILFDPYSTKEGTGSYLSSILYENGYKGEYHQLAFQNDFVAFGQIEDLMKQAHLDYESVINQIDDWTK